MSDKAVYKNDSDINFAIPETKRPPIYTSMKYWGKKPHNVWFEYISTYVPEGGIYLDPFAGSGMSGIEAIRAGRKAICLDVNPLTSFVFDVYCSDFDRSEFERAAKAIYGVVSNCDTYTDCFTYETGYILHNTKYHKNVPYELCFVSVSGNEKFERAPTGTDLQKNEESKNIQIVTEYPGKEFRKASAYGNAFLTAMGKTYDGLFTRKNLAVLSIIFDEIIRIDDCNLKKQLLFAFIQTVHLCCKMCVPRSKKTKRDYSTSWGRSAYFAASNSMEMNPLLVFYNNCIGKQSVSSALSFLKSYVGSIKGKNITDASGIDLSEDYDLWYGIKDSKRLAEFIAEGTVDFVLTDPPYGGLVPYLDLSYIWLAWLELYDPVYNPDYGLEISVNSEKTHLDFRNDMAEVLSQIKMVSKPDAKLVLTFNNKEPKIWSSLLGAIFDSGYLVERVIHQQNLRSGESNVVDKYGTSATDFYIRCVKKDEAATVLPVEVSEDYICGIAEDIIAGRAEPTPYQILLNGIITKLSGLPNAFENTDHALKVILQNSGRFETIENKDTLSGTYWWIKGMDYCADNGQTLTNRIRALLQRIFEETDLILHSELLKSIYREFPNGLMPDSVALERLISECADRKGALWRKK